MAKVKKLKNGYVVGSRFVEQGSVNPKKIFSRSITPSGRAGSNDMKRTANGSTEAR